MLVCSLVTMRVAVGGGRARGWKGAEAGWGQRQMADSRDCIMHPRVGETPTSTSPSPTRWQRSPGIFEEAGIYGGKGSRHAHHVFPFFDNE